MMHPLLTILATFCFLLGFIAFGTIAVGAFEHGRRVLCLFFMALAALSMMAADASIDATASALFDFSKGHPHVQE